jgi:ABC-type sugar transport system substrate-binding protein
MSTISRRAALSLLAAASAFGFAFAQPESAKPAKKIRVGFSQIGAESDWRKANTDSIKSEAATRGIELVFSDAQQKQENQIKALRNFVAQKVDVIAFSPVVETGWEPVLKEIKKAGIPVILTDRAVDVSQPDLFVTFIGADFVEEGRRAAEWLTKATDGKANVAELQGTPGSAPAIDRKKGFEEGIQKSAGIRIIKTQSGEFTRAKGREVMEAFLKSPEGKQINALYAHNDDMALGAIQAIEAAGLKPGVDIKIVSVDAVKAAFEAMIAGKLNCTVECSPLLGPQLFDAVQAIMDKKPIEKRIVTKAGVFEQANAAKDIKSRKY